MKNVNKGISTFEKYQKYCYKFLNHYSIFILNSLLNKWLNLTEENTNEGKYNSRINQNKRWFAKIIFIFKQIKLVHRKLHKLKNLTTKVLYWLTGKTTRINI
jgi:hypothetical protein